MAVSTDDDFVLLTGPPNGRAPKWGRSLLVEKSTGTIFAPAAISPPGEHATFFAATWEGLTILMQYKHAFVPLSFLEKEYPQWIDTYAKMREAAREAMERSET